MSRDVTTYPPLAPEEVWEEDEIARVPQRVTQLPRPPALSRTCHASHHQLNVTVNP